MADFRELEDLKCWLVSKELTLKIYRLFDQHNLKKDFVLRDQLTRASVSVMNNIAEGFGRKTNVEFLRFLDIALGSLMEVQSMLFLIDELERIDKVTKEDINNDIVECRKIIFGLIKYLKQNNSIAQTSK